MRGSQGPSQRYRRTCGEISLATHLNEDVNYVRAHTVIALGDQDNPQSDEGASATIQWFANAVMLSGHATTSKERYTLEEVAHLRAHHTKTGSYAGL